MRRHILATIVMLPLLLNLGQAAQRLTVDTSQVFGIPSEDWDANSYLGVDIVNITTERLGALKLKEEQGRRSDDGRSGRSGGQSRNQGTRRYPDHERNGHRKQDAIAADDPRNSSGTRGHAGIEPRWTGNDRQGATGRPAQRICSSVRRTNSSKTRISISRFRRSPISGRRYSQHWGCLRAFVDAKRRDGGESDAAAWRVFRREEREWSAGAIGGKGKPRREGRPARRRCDHSRRRPDDS